MSVGVPCVSSHPSAPSLTISHFLPSLLIIHKLHRSITQNRPDQKPEPIKGLPGILAAAIGRDIESVYNGNNKVRVVCIWEWGLTYYCS